MTEIDTRPRGTTTAVERTGFLNWAVLALAVGVAGLAVREQNPPRALPADAPPDVFSAGRAKSHVLAIARSPHPTGSEANARVRDILIQNLRDLGFEPEVQAPRDLSSGNGAAFGGAVRNVLVRSRGKGAAGKKAVLVCAHYDSVAAGPGAGDNASGVAAVLESLRALRAGPPLDRDLIVLFDDGEEGGLNGARLFVDEHPWAREVGLALNFDARGNGGPSVMFETSVGNGRLVREFAAAAPHPLATSMSMDIYRLLPNDTNLTVFKGAGMAGLNFAFSRGLRFYHTADDTPANLSPDTLQHQGENVLAMTRHFGRLDLDDLSGEDVVYFSVLNRTVVAYPARLALPFALGLLLVWLGTAALAVRRGEATLSGLALAFVFWGVAFAAVLILEALSMAAAGVVAARSGVSLMRYDLPILAFGVVAAVVVFLAVERRVARRLSLTALSLGALAWWVLAALPAGRWLPGASYLLTWPAAFALLGLGAALLARPGSPLRPAARFAGSVPALVMLAPLLREIVQGLSLPMFVPLMGLTVLFLGPALPLLGPLLAPGGARSGLDRT